MLHLVINATSYNILHLSYLDDLVLTQPCSWEEFIKEDFSVLVGKGSKM